MEFQLSKIIASRLLALLSVMLIAFSASATHNRAGEITFKHKSGYTYTITVTTYTRYDPANNIESNQADRSALDINFGDSTVQNVTRSQPIDLPGLQIRKNTYTVDHTYPGPGTYFISMVDPNRNKDIRNMGFEYSDLVPFALQTTLIITPFETANNSPVLNYPPIDNACLFRVFWHNPQALDVDGDSLSYSLVVPYGGRFYTLDTIYNLPAITTINQNGDLRWSVPDTLGLYNFAIEIKEWRRRGSNWIHIGTIIRDLQVEVKNCNNENPDLSPFRDTCVVAGTFLSDTIFATDPDFGQTVIITASGAPFVQANPAQFTHLGPASDTSRGVFNWQTACSNVRRMPYQVYFQAKDNDLNVPLLDIDSWRITVVGPAPQNLVAIPVGTTIKLNWDQSVCSEVESYQIYRRQGSYGFIPDHCELGVPAYTGFTLLATVDGLSNTTFVDNNNGAGLIHGHDYCYMVVAIFPDEAESYASNEACAMLKLDVPVITNVSVLSTGTNGIDSIAWSKPRLEDFDTTNFKGPFRYLIYRAEGITGGDFALIDSTALNATLDDTNYVDNNVNTTHANSYRITLVDYTGGVRTVVGSTNNASSVFLQITPSDNINMLTWTENVPWTNTSYVVYRQLPGSAQFDSITTVPVKTYTDTGLANGEEYCYYIKSIGAYSHSGLVNPIINLSQEACSTPIDLIPPCAPELKVEKDCELPLNTLTWTNPNLSCADDVVEYRIYYKPNLSASYFKIGTIQGASEITLTHEYNGSIAGCYYVTAVDSFSNESIRSNEFCIDNCPNYSLPNVFTPDGDGMNDYFRPYPYKFVESIDLEIYNRWGQIVFTSSDPDIMWNGTSIENGKELSEGVYYYTCVVNEYRLEGIVPRVLTGFVHLFRGRDSSPQQN